MDIKVDRVVVGAIETNCYIVTCLITGKSLVIDPGDDYPKIQQASAGRKISVVLNTHGHIDHIKEDEKFGVPVYIHSYDKDCLTDAAKNLSVLFDSPITLDVETVILKDGDIIRLGEMVFKVIHTPGHSRGSVCFFIDNILFSGDTLFCGSYGRTDLPGGSEKDIFTSIQQKLLLLPSDTLVYPGHGEKTTIAQEKKLWAER